jgi:hypothetical protein
MNTTLTWTEQVLASTIDEVKPVDRNTAGIEAGQPMLYPSARLIEEYIRAIPEGESRDIATLRRDLAASRGALATSLPTLRERLLAIAEAAFDELDDGALLREVTPVWRVHIEHSDVLLNRLSFEPDFLFDLREGEQSRPVEIDRQAA